MEDIYDRGSKKGHKKNLKCELSLQNIWFICLGLTGFGLKRNGAEIMEICYIFIAPLFSNFLIRARLQFLEKQKRVFHSFFVSLFLQRRARVRHNSVKVPIR